jgi:transcriptional regulator with XRE-family HTH domain
LLLGCFLAIFTVFSNGALAVDQIEAQLLSETGQRLRDARAQAGLNLHQLARLCGISAPALSLIETGKRDPRLTTLSRIAKALRLPLAEVLAPPAVSNDPSADPSQTSAGGYDLGDYQ